MKKTLLILCLNLVLTLNLKSGEVITNIVNILPILETNIYTNVTVYVEKRSHVIDYTINGVEFKVTNTYEKVWHVISPLLCPPIPDKIIKP